MLVANYPTKKALKASIGKQFRSQETSLFGVECRPNVMLTVVGPSAYVRKWYANVWLDSNFNVVKVR